LIGVAKLQIFCLSSQTKVTILLLAEIFRTKRLNPLIKHCISIVYAESANNQCKSVGAIRAKWDQGKVFQSVCFK
jgi:hypothetical protein